MLLLGTAPLLAAPEIPYLKPVRKEDRILILAPHPDDEAIGCAGIIQQAVAAGAQVGVAYLTNGDHNEVAFIVHEKHPAIFQRQFINMGEKRKREAVKAMQLLGLKEDNLIFLGYPDFGTFAIFSQYWQPKEPYMSLLTRISSVPYKDNLSFGAPYVGQSILADLKKMLLKFRPNKIFVSHPADVNLDHKTFYLFLQVALSDLSKDIPEPEVYPYLIHCVGWPLPRHFHPALSLGPPDKFRHSPIQWRKLNLDARQVERKRKAILCYASQTNCCAFYLLSFARRNELFGDYPEAKVRREGSIKERGRSFFGFAQMFRDADVGILGGLEGLGEERPGVSYGAADNSILIRVEKREEMVSRFNLQVYLFGYSHKTDFAGMPKIHIAAKSRNFRVFANGKMITPDGVFVILKPKAYILGVPLEILGNPDFVLTSMKVYGGTAQAASIGAQKVEIE